jgi:hypothetical protein
MKKYLPTMAVLIVAGAGLGYWYYQKSDEPKTNTQTSNQQSSKNTQNTNDPSEDGKYLVIKEWNVRFLLPSEFEGDITYFEAKDVPDVIRLVSKKYGRMILQCSMDWGGFLGLHRENLAISEQITPPKFKKINNFGYYFTGTACEESSSFQGTVKDSHNELRESITETLELIQGV